MVRSVAQAAVVSVGWLTMAIPSLAASQQFPYSATVIADDVEVRCGPGSKFYVTGSLTKQDEVTVHRHDHGGWYMIAPPQGSFSWIEATLVEKSGDQGTVTIDLAEAPTGRATVYIGSQSGRDHSYFGRELTNGDQVQILGEEVLQMPQGATRMYKIVPPSQEFRWVKGEFLVPTDQTLQQRLAEDPYQIPPRHRQRLATLDLKPIGATEMAQADDAKPILGVPMESGPQLALTQEPPISQKGLAVAEAFDDRARLEEIDQQYAALMRRDPKDWDLDQIEQDYRELQHSASSSVASAIDQRLSVVARRKEIAEHYRRFVRLTNETSSRDAQLAAQQAQYQVTASISSPESEVPYAPIPVESPPQFAMQPIPSESGSSPEIQAPVTPRLNGAGIIRPLQSFPGQPTFGLFAPDGRFLAHLEFAPGVDVRSWIGKEAGLIGQRSHNPRTGTDFIRVQRVVPVRLSE